MLKEHLEEIKELRKYHTLQEIADWFCCSSERIRQILLNETIKRVPVNKKIYIVSSDCKVSITFYPKQCPICKRHFIVHNNWKNKPKHWIYAPRPKNRKFCSQECYSDSSIFKNLRRCLQGLQNMV